MMKFLVLFAAVSLSGCASMYESSKILPDSYYQQRLAADLKAGEESNARYKALLAKGAMDPLDRLEVEVNNEYLNAKYGTNSPHNTDVMDDIPESRE
jgi:hypothetical protein